MTEDRKKLVKANAEMMAEGLTRETSPSTDRYAMVSTPLRKAAALVLCLVFLLVFIAEAVQAYERKLSNKPLWATWFVHNDGIFFAAPLLFWWYRDKQQRSIHEDPISALDADDTSPWSAMLAIIRDPRARWVTLALSAVIFLAEWVCFYQKQQQKNNNHPTT